MKKLRTIKKDEEKAKAPNKSTPKPDSFSERKNTTKEKQTKASKTVLTLYGKNTLIWKKPRKAISIPNIFKIIKIRSPSKKEENKNRDEPIILKIVYTLISLPEFERKSKAKQKWAIKTIVTPKKPAYWTRNSYIKKALTIRRAT